MAKYKVVVFSKDGKAMGNIFSLCENFSWSKTRNDAESVSFDLNLDRYEEYITAIGFGDNPRNFLETGRNDIRIMRNGQWLLGTNVIKFGYAGGDKGVTMKVSCSGYLNYYKRRYLDIDYDDTPQEQIIWGVINAANQLYGGDYGIRFGAHKGGTVLRDRHQKRKEIKSFIQQMTQVLGGPDIEITHDKKLNTYEAIGAYRPGLRLVYPGNISGWAFDRSVERVSNFIYGIGSGNGDDAVQAESEDEDSEDYLYRREQIVTYNSVVDETTLQQNIDAAKHYAANPIELPTITLEDGVLDLSVVGIGDTLPIEMRGNKSLAHINGYYRIESIVCNVDKNGAETVDLTFDDIDIDDIIALQDPENAA
jgi:hypothetical protein